MIEQGALDEVRAFQHGGLDWTMPFGRVLGARELRRCLRGEIGLAEAVAGSVTATRQFAKRQRTWFRNKMPDWQRLDPIDDPLSAVPEY